MARERATGAGVLRAGLRVSSRETGGDYDYRVYAGEWRDSIFAAQIRSFSEMPPIEWVL